MGQAGRQAIRQRGTRIMVLVTLHWVSHFRLGLAFLVSNRSEVAGGGAKEVLGHWDGEPKE